MRLILKNVGRFYRMSEIEFNGITVIAGANGTGKSTIGKVLYCVFDSLYNLKGQIRDEKYRFIYNRIRFQYLDAFDVLKSSSKRAIVDEILNYEQRIEYSELRDKMEELLDGALDDDNFSFDDFCKDIYNVISVSDNQIKKSLLNYRFAAEFDGQVKNVNYADEDAYIELKIRDELIRININDEAEYESDAKILKKVIYIDDLSSVNLEPNHLFPRGLRQRFSHYFQLSELITDDEKKNETLIDDIIKKDKYKELVNKMNNEGIGIISRNQRGDFEYKTKEFKKAISITNLSSGTKIFAVLRKLIECSGIEENGVIIFDEPESHLHPEWQYILAELIVLMQVKLDMTILISTHSADFVTFIEYFSKLYDVKEKVNFYLLGQDKKPGTSVIKDVSDSVDEIYKMLGNAFIKTSEELSDEES